MRSAEVRAVGELAGHALSGTGTLVRDMHAAIARRAFEAVGPRGDSARTVHDEVSAPVHSGVRAALRAMPQTVGAAPATTALDEAPALAESSRGALALAVLNACAGDALEARGDELALDMTLRHGGADVALIDDLHDAWPQPIDELVLIGHSMGGLVARSACHYGRAGGHRWTHAVRHVICLGSRHLGAPLEKGANALGWALGRVPETEPLAGVVNARSAGIKDLRFGACIEEDWCDCDPDELLTDRCHDVPFLPGATFSFIAATIGREPLGSVVGDLVVRVPSASGKGRHRRIALADGRRLEALNHFDLLNHPAVYEQIRAWLAR
jgi:pimeloyl-ACP methyl ester carboxylesterase